MTHEKSMKKVLSTLLAAVMLFAFAGMFPTVRAYAETNTENDWGYNIVGGGVDIVFYSGLEENINVPAKLAGRNVYSVSGLCNAVTRSNVKSVSFENGIKVLGDMVLSDYTALERVALPNTLTSIGNDAFFNCFSLKAITLPSSVTSIGTAAFAGCSSLLSASLASQVKAIPDRAFEDCSSLSTLSLPPYLTSIGNYAFHNCSSLKTIVLPNTIQTFGTGAFQNCSSVTSINMPIDLKSVGSLAFDRCAGINSVFLPGKIKTVSENAFRDCTGLTDVYISSSIDIIEKNAFSNCSNLKTVVFGGGYINLNSAFDITSIPTVYYPVKEVDSWDAYSGRKSSYSGASSISITGTTKLNPGKTSKLTVSINPKSGEFNDVYYLTSSNPAVASIAQDGTVTTKIAGSTVITATTVNGKTGTATVTVTPPSPTSLKVTAKSTSSAELSWTGDSAGYIIYRASSKNGSYKKIDTVLTTSYTDKGLTKGKTYYYKVAGYVNSEQQQVVSEQTKPVSITITAPAPSTVSAKKTKSGTASISWSKAVGASGYEVYMASSKNGKFSKITTIKSASTLTYKKTKLTKNKTYYFKVRSYVTVDGAKKYSKFSKVVKVKA